VPDDPFADLGVDRTVIMPVPGGRPAPGRAAPAPGQPRPSAVDQTEVGDAVAVSSGLNPLIAAANRLLDVLPQLRSSVQHPNPTALRDSLAQGVRQFEAQARAAGVTTEKIVAARYALCTLIDETATSTPLGTSGAWAHQGLLALFHGETGGGEKFFQLLSRLAENPHANLDLLELMYVCLEFGFEGRFRILDGGQRQLEAIRQRLLQIIRKQRGEYERDLSPNWRGLGDVAQRRLGWLPLWVVGAVTGVALIGIYVGFHWNLGSASDRLAAEIASLRVAAPVAPRAAAAPRLATFLQDEIRRGLVKVDDHLDRSVVTILGDGLFKPGEATIGSENLGLLARIGDALRGVPGPVDVIGHTDNVPIRTLRFPSNWELSKARAESVARILSARVPPERLRADGRGEAEPVAPNDTTQGRAKNRRVEITLHVPVPAGSTSAPPAAAPAAGAAPRTR
jgi:type VI secretion system protein ImpK